jgi:hypothetical protein
MKSMNENDYGRGVVKIENPERGMRCDISTAAAEAMIMNNRAVGVVRLNGMLATVRLTGRPQNVQRDSRGGYDDVSRLFHAELVHVPVINPEKMIRREESSREWSFQRATRPIRRSDTEEEVAELRAHARRPPPADFAR